MRQPVFKAGFHLRQMEAVCINPKGITSHQMYGEMDPLSNAAMCSAG